MRHYLLVHGAWGAGKEFNNINRLLSEAGRDVTALDLPGHGNNQAHPSEVTLSSYVQEVIRVVEGIGSDVILVGHSLGGAVISRVAELIPDKVNRLIYIAAMLPASGVTPQEILQRGGDNELLPHTRLSEEDLAVTLDPDAVATVMLNDMSDEDEIERLKPQFLMQQPALPFSAPIELSHARFGAVPKFYIRAALDKVIPPDLQDQMVKNWKVEQVFHLESGHFPFFSMPEELVNVLCEAESY